MAILIKGARAIQPGSRFNGQRVDILIEKDRISRIQAYNPTESMSAEFGYQDAEEDVVVDASALIAVPGLIDMHVHLRQPGYEYKETIESGATAAAHGGITAVCAMPNTNPVNDNEQVTSFIVSEAERVGMARVYPVAAISRGSRGESLCEFSELRAAGAVAVSDDGWPVKNSLLMRRALEYAKGFGILVISHCEDPDLAPGGVMNEGAVSTRMGLSGIANAVESIMVMRDIALAELTGAPVHIAHVSTMESVRAISEAKKRGARVTAETAPHYFSLTDKAVENYDTNAKMNPPLRSEKDRQAIIEGLRDGTLDVIATDHAPHDILEKEVEFDRAANGIIGLETSLPLCLRLVRRKILSMEQLVEKMSLNPAKILGIERGLVDKGKADITLIDPDDEFVVDVDKFQSKARNCPFHGWRLTGRAAMTIVEGKIVFQDTAKLGGEKQ